MALDDQAREALRFIDNNLGMLRHAQATFLMAMKQGYASSAKKSTMDALPGSKTIEYVHDKWRVLDLYYVGPGGTHSSGTTMMWYGPIPIWSMHYAGKYLESAEICLRAALKAAYLSEEFVGGRGPTFFTCEGYVYINTVERKPFSGAAGIERIFNLNTGEEVGYHRYNTMWLVSRK